MTSDAQEKKAPVRPLTPSEIRFGKLSGIKEGQRLCVIGLGVDNLAHRHVTVTGFTKLYIKTETRDGIVERFRRDDGSSVPYSAYGGTQIHLSCQRPRKAKELPWVIPEWMKPYAKFIYNSDGHDIEKLVNDWRNQETFNRLKAEDPNYYSAALQVAAQLLMLEKLHKEGKLA